jgi:hypothetical protein
VTAAAQPQPIPLESDKWGLPGCGCSRPLVTGGGASITKHLIVGGGVPMLIGQITLVQ